MLNRVRFFVGVAVLGGAVELASAASAMRPGLWEAVVQADMGGPAAARPPSRVCLSQKDIDDNSKTLPKPSSNCAVVAPKTVNDKTSYDLVCQGASPMRGHGDITTKPNSYEGTVVMSLRAAPYQPETPLKFTFAGKRVGECGDAK